MNEDLLVDVLNAKLQKKETPQNEKLKVHQKSLIY